MINQELTSCCSSPLETTGNIVKQEEDRGIDHVTAQPQLHYKSVTAANKINIDPYQSSKGVAHQVELRFLK